MAFILNLLWSNWPRRVLTQFLTQLTSYYCSLVKSSRRRAVLHHKILPAVRAVFLSGRCSIRFQTIYAEVTQSGQIQGDGLACWSIGNSARISILMLHWVMVIKYETSMISARIQPVSRIWNSARTSVQTPNRIRPYRQN